MTRSWGILCKIIPGFKDAMVKLGNQKRVRDAVCREVSLFILFSLLILCMGAQIASGIEGARSDDTSGLKFKIIGYLLADTKVPLTPTIAPDDLKDMRGWNHPVTAGLLCPIEYDANEKYVLLSPHC
jgi:hypothetical protein